MKKTETEQILELPQAHRRVNQRASTTAGRPKDDRPLSERMGTMEKKVDSLDKKVDGLDKKVDSLDKKVDKLDTRVSEVQLGLATLAADTKAQFQKVDERFQTIDARFDAVDVQFKKVNRNIAAARVELVDHMERIHSELTGRIVDLETPGTEGGGEDPAAAACPWRPNPSLPSRCAAAR